MSAERTEPVRVLIVDDSAVARRSVALALAGEPAIEIAGFARHGREALEQLARLEVDLVLLDLQMPELDGLGVLAELRARAARIPVLVFSSQTSTGARSTIAALLAGAGDFAHKPTALSGGDAVRRALRDLLVPRVLALAGRARTARRGLCETTVIAPGARFAAARAAPACDVVAIGSSTGGPAALAELLRAVGPGLRAPLLVVQHLPAAYTGALAESLAEFCGLDVREARAGDPLLPGRCLVAPGDRHLQVERQGGVARAVLGDAEPENSCRPSVDVLFRSVAALYGARALALVLTGMGRDGLEGARELRGRGAAVLAQDEASSVVWGMPGQIVRAGLADRVRDLPGLAAEVRARAAAGRVADAS